MDQKAKLIEQVTFSACSINIAQSGKQQVFIKKVTPSYLCATVMLQDCRSAINPCDSLTRAKEEHVND